MNDGKKALLIRETIVEDEEPEDEEPEVDADGFRDVEDFASFMQAAEGLEQTIEGAQAALRLLARIAVAHLTAKAFDEVELDLLLRTIADKIGAGRRALKENWKVILAEAEKRIQHAAAAHRAAADQREREEAERRLKEERERLWASCGHLASNPKLLDEMEKVAHQLGLVNEGSAARGVYLTCTSRLLAGAAVRMLRVGASASGKNIPVEIVLALIPPEAIVHISGASPRSLPYYGGDDQDALKHKIVYMPEAAGLTADRDSDNPFASMFRTLISEGRVYYQTVVTEADGTRHTETMIKNGPIGAILTSAKDIDLETKTRVLIQETNESGEQTEVIVKGILSERKTKPDLLPWLDLQKYLEDGAPYRVEIPFKEAIYKAFEKWRPGFLKIASMRMRRDTGGLLVVIEASAVLHKAQRGVNADGAIVAEIDDYRHAYDAFGEGLGTVHGKADDKLVATVAAIEAMRNEHHDLQGGKVKVTLRELAKRLRVGSIATAKARIDVALEYGAIEQDDAMTGRGGARWFDVIMASEDIEVDLANGAFPPPEIVAKLILAGGGGSAEQTEQKTGGDAKARL
jgi:hypothetical protein